MKTTKSSFGLDFRAVSINSGFVWIVIRSIYLYKDIWMDKMLLSLRDKDYLSIAYLDDFLLIGNSRRTCLENVAVTYYLH